MNHKLPTKRQVFERLDGEFENILRVKAIYYPEQWGGKRGTNCVICGRTWHKGMAHVVLVIKNGPNRPDWLGFAQDASWALCPNFDACDYTAAVRT